MHIKNVLRVMFLLAFPMSICSDGPRLVRQQPIADLQAYAAQQAEKTAAKPVLLWQKGQMLLAGPGPIMQFFKAIREGDFAQVETIIKQNPSFAEAIDDLTGLTGLHVAAKHAQDSVIKLLLDNGAVSVINYQASNGYTPLHFAAESVSPTIVADLVNNGANPNIRDKQRRKPIDLLPANGGEVEFIKTLLEGYASKFSNESVR